MLQFFHTGQDSGIWQLVHSEDGSCSAAEFSSFLPGPLSTLLLPKTSDLVGGMLVTGLGEGALECDNAL